MIFDIELFKKGYSLEKPNDKKRKMLKEGETTATFYEAQFYSEPVMVMSKLKLVIPDMYGDTARVREAAATLF